MTEPQPVSVPVSREELTVEREPLIGANRDVPDDRPAISQEQPEVVLREERPVVETEAVPVGWDQGLGAENRTEQETVDPEVREEEIEVAANDPQAAGRPGAPT